MAAYKYTADISFYDHAMFDALIEPGTRVTYSGIYKCKGCGKEAALNGGDPAPPQNHHQHSTAQGKIQWRLIVLALTAAGG